MLAVIVPAHNEEAHLDARLSAPPLANGPHFAVSARAHVAAKLHEDHTDAPAILWHGAAGIAAWAARSALARSATARTSPAWRPTCPSSSAKAMPNATWRRSAKNLLTPATEPWSL